MENKERESLPKRQQVIFHDSKQALLWLMTNRQSYLSDELGNQYSIERGDQIREDDWGYGYSEDGSYSIYDSKLMSFEEFVEAFDDKKLVGQAIQV